MTDAEASKNESDGKSTYYDIIAALGSETLIGGGVQYELNIKVMV
jgi:hypothetical protein